MILLLNTYMFIKEKLGQTSRDKKCIIPPSWATSPEAKPDTRIGVKVINRKCPQGKTGRVVGPARRGSQQSSTEGTWPQPHRELWGETSAAPMGREARDAALLVRQSGARASPAAATPGHPGRLGRCCAGSKSTQRRCLRVCRGPSNVTLHCNRN